MVPALWPGESVTVTTAKIGELQPGEIVVFARDGHLVVHRIARAFTDAIEPLLITRGDAESDHDLPIGAADLLGVVTAVHRHGDRRALNRHPSPFARGIGWTMRRSRLAHFAWSRFAALTFKCGSLMQPTRDAL